MDLRAQSTPNPSARSPLAPGRPDRPAHPAQPQGAARSPDLKVCLPAYPRRRRSLPRGAAFPSGPASRRAGRGGKARAPRPIKGQFFYYFHSTIACLGSRCGVLIICQRRLLYLWCVFRPRNFPGEEVVKNLPASEGDIRD